MDKKIIAIFEGEVPMKYILTPFTMLLWFLVTYYGIYYSIIGLSVIFFTSWIWLIIGYPFLIGIFGTIFISLPQLLRYLIIKLYGNNWFSIVSHSLAGAVGVIGILMFFFYYPPTIEIGSSSYFILAGMWEVAPFKMIFLAIPFFGIVMALVILPVITPILMKLDEDQGDLDIYEA